MTVVRVQPPTETRHSYTSLSTDKFPGTSDDGHPKIPKSSVLEYTDTGQTFQFDGSQWWPTGITMTKAIENLTEAVEALTTQLVAEHRQ